MLETLGEISKKSLFIQEKLGVDVNLKEICWMTNATKTLGKANSMLIDGVFQSQLKISKNLWPKTPASLRDELIAHEVCHLVNRFQEYEKDKVMGYREAHGIEWNYLMKKLGFKDPKKHHNLANFMSNRPYRATCNCPNRIIGLTSIRAKRLKEGTKYMCRECKTTIKPANF